MASKRGLAIVPIIFICRVLSMELSCAENSLRQPSEKDDVISCRMDLEHHFEKKQGFINVTIHQPQFNINESLGPDDCPRRCWESCSCIAYGAIHENGTGCIMYEGKLEITETFLLNQYIYVLNVTPSYDGSDGGTGKTIRQTGPLTNNPNRIAKKRFLMWLLLAAPPALAMCVVSVMCYSRTKRAKISRGLELKGKELGKGKFFTSESQIRPSYTGSPKLEKSKKLGSEMQIFSIRTIWTATNQFSSANKLGEGGFGPVYKGYLPDGKEIAVKRLSSCSSQGIAEFKNEIRLVAQLQHTNLVRLLGCCIGRGEKILVYEFLPHKSLDSFLFDPIKKRLLDWQKRFDIIEGIAQGLLYLHKYSRLKVIHRDLKTSNILLDGELNPRISDFGLARIFDKNITEGNTNRVAGTYGYMSPEYAMEGLYSEKSDVFSFGVIILEIMSGKKTTSLSGTDRSLNLIGHAWDLWREGKSLELIDRTIGETCGREELLRYIHVGLLCVEVSVAERPTMSDVIYMLTNSAMVIPVPKQPAFYNWRSNSDVILHQHKVKDCSLNFASMSPIQGR